MGDWNQIARSLFFVVDRERDPASANFAVLGHTRIAGLLPAEENLLVYLRAFYTQYGSAPAADTVQKWVESQCQPVLLKLYEDICLDNPVYGADFTEALTREVAAGNVRALTVLFQETLAIARGPAAQPSSPVGITAARAHLLDGLAHALRDDTTGQLPLIPFAELTEKPLAWFWQDRIPAGKLCFLVGDPDQGKSMLTIDLAARVTCGTAFPDGAPCQPGHVLLMSSEDDPQDTILPRLRVAGANLAAVRTLPLDKTGFCLESDLPTLEATLRANPEIRLVILDPLTAYWGASDTGNDKEVRQVLAELWRVMAQTGVTVIGILHFRKSSGSALDRVMGSRAFTAAPRAVWGCGPHPDGDDPARHVFLKIKGNLGPPVEGLAYHTVGVGPLGKQIVRLQWEAGSAAYAPNVVFAGTGEKVVDNSPRAEIESWLRDVLANGPLPAKAVGDLADGCRFKWRTVLRVSTQIGVKKEQTGFHGGWVWSLPALAAKKTTLLSPLDSVSAAAPQKTDSHASVSPVDSVVGVANAPTQKTTDPRSKNVSSVVCVDSVRSVTDATEDTGDTLHGGVESVFCDKKSIPGIDPGDLFDLS